MKMVCAFDRCQSKFTMMMIMMIVMLVYVPTAISFSTTSTSLLYRPNPYPLSPPKSAIGKKVSQSQNYNYFSKSSGTTTTTTTTTTQLSNAMLHSDSSFVLSTLFLTSAFGITLERQTTIGKALSVRLLNLVTGIII